jgi:hypothetical protein
MAKKSTDELAERYALMKEERDTFEVWGIKRSGSERKTGGMLERGVFE